MERGELEQLLSASGEPSYRGTQVFQWLHRRRVSSFADMTNLPKELRIRLAEWFRIDPIVIRRKQVDPVDGTRKYLFGLKADDESVETVLMKHHHGNSLCVSTQVGCRMGCRFCASTLDGRLRNLSAAEIVGQALAVQRDLDQENERISHVVVMGMGEPLENYDATVKFLKIIHDPQGLGIGWRHLTVSTCGLVPQIHQLADEGLPVTLAVSLHAPNDHIRSRIMPVNVRYPLRELLDACRYYVRRTGRRISFEYIMLADVNDDAEHARELVSLVSGIKCHFNLIPFNPVPERPFRASTPERINKFAAVLQAAGVPTTVRRNLGRNIDAACGQLRRRHRQARRNRPIEIT